MPDKIFEVPPETTDHFQWLREQEQEDANSKEETDPGDQRGRGGQRRLAQNSRQEA